MYVLREVVYVSSVPHKKKCLLAGDIGGTNSNFGFFIKDKSKFILLFSLHAKSQEVTNFVDLVNQVLDYAQQKYEITIKDSCFAGAGLVSQARDYCKPTNLNFEISAKELLLQTPLHCAMVVNDFEVIGYGIAMINQDAIVAINAGAYRPHGVRGVIGAGTGLGKCSLLWSDHDKRYKPLPSEGGHGDFAGQEKIEYELLEFIHNEEKRTAHISWEDVLSGNGIKRIYHFFKARNNAEKFNARIAQQGFHPDFVFKNRHLDSHCMNTYLLYQKFYARCAKNFALDVLTLGGLFIAGGIAAHNLKLFQELAFMEEFTNCDKQRELLKQIPVFVITDYNVSLYGAVVYMIREELCA